MPQIKLNTEVELYISPEKLAIIFANMDGDEQAVFFNCIAIQFKQPHLFNMQMQCVTDSEDLNKNGREVMKTIGDYAANNYKQL